MTYKHLLIASAMIEILFFGAIESYTSAAVLAASSHVAIVFVSQWESEDMDVPGLHFTDVIHSIPIDQDAWVRAVAVANPNTIVVLENGGPAVMPWLADTMRYSKPGTQDSAAAKPSPTSFSEMSIPRANSP